MKGLLLKDWCMLKKYCRSYLFILGVFVAAGMVDADNTFFVIYPMVLLELLPITLMAYDERSKWDVYCGTLPITREQQVTGKYLLLLILEGVGFVLTSLVQLVRMIWGGDFILQEFLMMEGTLVLLGLLCPSILLPIVYKLGSEKGRMMYFIVIIAVCAIAFSLGALQTEGFELLERIINLQALPLLMLIFCLVVLAGSWRLSVMFYRKREL